MSKSKLPVKFLNPLAYLTIGWSVRLICGKKNSQFALIVGGRLAHNSQFIHNTKKPNFKPERNKDTLVELKPHNYAIYLLGSLDLLGLFY